MQLFLSFYGLAVLTGVRIDPWPAVTVAFTMYAAAFLGEIWRGAIQAIPAPAVGGGGGVAARAGVRNCAT